MIGIEEEEVSEIRSFFLYAGAGSGKTRNLIQRTRQHLATKEPELQQRAKKLAVITYTKAAAEEIRQRLGRNDLVEIGTIHSFAWPQIAPFTEDIRRWLLSSKKEEILRLGDEISKQRTLGSKAAKERQSSLNRATKMLGELPNVRRFRYSPTGSRSSSAHLTHNEVISIFAAFLRENNVFREIFVGSYPVLFIDEVQDTNKELLDAVLFLEREMRGRIEIGFFGDTLQRIYSDGKPDLDSAIPAEWERPEIEGNWRSASRIVDLVNAIRSAADNRKQVAKRSEEGIARLFLADVSLDRKSAEQKVRTSMARICGDDSWTEDGAVKTLVIEHAQAAARLGFATLLSAVSVDDKIKESLFDRDRSVRGEVGFVLSAVIPVFHAARINDRAKIENLVRKLSRGRQYESMSEEASELTSAVQEMMTFLGAIRSGEIAPDPSLNALLPYFESPLWEIPTGFTDALTLTHEGASEEPTDMTSNAQAAFNLLSVKMSEFESYYQYISGSAPFDTHQGVKGLEFPRVLGILDDSESKGFLFKYERLFGAEPLTKTDLENAKVGKDNAISRALRLLYVVCSRAEDSLALILYTSDPKASRSTALESNWFTEDEIIQL